MSIEYVRRFIGPDGKPRVVVDPSDPATVEAAAEALAAEYYAHYDGAPAYDDVLARYFTRLAAAVLAAIATPTDAETSESVQRRAVRVRIDVRCATLAPLDSVTVGDVTRRTAKTVDGMKLRIGDTVLVKDGDVQGFFTRQQDGQMVKNLTYPDPKTPGLSVHVHNGDVYAGTDWTWASDRFVQVVGEPSGGVEAVAQTLRGHLFEGADREGSVLHYYCTCGWSGLESHNHHLARVILAGATEEKG